ncbi:XdhC family protein [Amycolatopsis suaedae]|uniref:XdhC/CoxI family protein n=1 Tax=Amycolatopsis suaedae TaxID=2510978 RepID=A0A4Q7JAF7_9PSEU|nr:XdhC family protein [Amycolatopsis suaedae]RZQ63956.1 XdhC/CoxI family protein [Amycolatopsis suaedae]
MRDIATDLVAWAAAGETFAVATVVAVRGSAPREPGAALAVRADGTALGSVSGGCVEGAVYELARQVIAGGRPARQRYGFTSDDPFAVGLTCGGELEVFVQPVSADRDPGLVAALATGEPVALARVVDDSALAGRSVAVFADRHVGTVGAGLDELIVAEARAMLEQGRTGSRVLGCAPGAEVLVESWVRPPRMLVFGAVDFAAAVAGAGRFLGYHVVVCDARATFATRQRFPAADEVVVDWPHRYLARTPTDSRTVVCVLTHDPKFDVPVLTEALRRDVAYVGALGSRRTHADRLGRLRAAGLGEAELARLRSPIGLDLGARTPEETALSIAAEIVAVNRGGTGLPLAATDGPIHREPALSVH